MTNERRTHDTAATDAIIASRIARSNRDIAWDLNNALQDIRAHQRFGDALDLDKLASVLYRANQAALASEERADFIAHNLRR